MIKILQINSVVNTGSTGHITEEIGNLVLANGWQSYIAYGRKALSSKSQVIRIGNKFDIFFHVFITRFFDLHGLASTLATKKFVRQIKKICPDLIHLHNIHGYYLNYKILFKYLAKSEIPIIWTLHDCWPITGHCAHYTFFKCEKFHLNKGCKKCQYKKEYPSCIFFSNAYLNYCFKNKYFNLLSDKQLTIITPSKWLSNEVAKSFLGHYNRVVINNGIDLNLFKPVTIQKKENNKFIILGVSSVWNQRKGYYDFLNLASLLSSDEEIILVGLNQNQMKNLPHNIKGIQRTENIQQLIELYSYADVYFNASVEESFGMTCIEAQACGTPVVGYNSTAVPETFNNSTGILVEKNNIEAVYEAIKKIRASGKESYYSNCINLVREKFNNVDRINDVLQLYKNNMMNK